jgi:hypothetical protein
MARLYANENFPLLPLHDGDLLLRQPVPPVQHALDQRVGVFPGAPLAAICIEDTTG